MLKVGLVYKVMLNVFLFVNVVQLFMLQLLIVSYIGELLLEEFIFYEVGVKFDLLNGIIVNIVLFDIYKCNVLYIESIGDEMVVKMVGKVCFQGVEVDLVGFIIDNFSVIVSYGYIDVKVLEDLDYVGKLLLNVLKYIGLLFLIYDIYNVYNSNILIVGGGGYVVSKCFGINGVDYYLQGYVVVDVFVVYKMKLQYLVILQVNVKNLFDKIYYIFLIGINNFGNQIGDLCEVQFMVKMDF